MENEIPRNEHRKNNAWKCIQAAVWLWRALVGCVGGVVYNVHTVYVDRKNRPTFHVFWLLKCALVLSTLQMHIL